jgi:hypothetical protein
LVNQWRFRFGSERELDPGLGHIVPTAVQPRRTLYPLRRSSESLAMHCRYLTIYHPALPLPPMKRDLFTLGIINQFKRLLSVNPNKTIISDTLKFNRVKQIVVKYHYYFSFSSPVVLFIKKGL